MKQILALVIIITMIVTGCNNVNNSILESSASYEQIRVNNTDISAEVEIGHTEPPYQIYIDGENELSEMRKMAKASEEEIFEYLHRMDHAVSGMKNSKDLITFLELIDSLPVPYIRELKFSHIVYYPDTELMPELRKPELIVAYVSEEEERFSFRFHVYEENKQGIVEQREKRETGEQLIEAYQKRDGENQFKVYFPPKTWGFPSERGVFFFPMEINGYYIVALYSQANRRTLEVNFEEMFKDVKIVSLADEPWTARVEESAVDIGVGEARREAP
ncbi:MAG: hypothetical protein FWG70_08985 [Oscillospiraceae bacterium]|nr:hypothetical protein [Oscillospiraceae bacterium]